MSEKPTELENYPENLEEVAPYGPYRAAITRVVDGDTIYALMNLGFSVYHLMSIRLTDIDAPELFSGPKEGREKGAASKEFLESFIDQRGTHCAITSEKWSQSFGRYVARVQLSDGTDLSEEMVRAGYADWSKG